MVVLKDYPDLYETPRSYGELLQGVDAAAALFEASRSYDEGRLRDLLSDPDQVRIALEEPHRIYSRSSSGGGDSPRTMLAMPILNLAWAMKIAAESGDPNMVGIILDFGSRHNVTLIDRDAASFRMLIERANVHVFKTFVARDSNVVHFPLAHGKFPLDVAVRRFRTEMVEFILTHSAFEKLRNAYGGYGDGPKQFGQTLLADAVTSRDRVRIVELLLTHGFKPAKSEALHRASGLGALETMRLLIEHGADVNERAAEGPTDVEFKTCPDIEYTPMHAAAVYDQTEAMKLLRSHGAERITATKT